MVEIRDGDVFNACGCEWRAVDDSQGPKVLAVPTDDPYKAEEIYVNEIFNGEL